MGTRNITAVYHQGSYRLAQYGQWDGYPCGQGATVLAFLRKMDRARFVSNLYRCPVISEDELRARWKALGADDSGFVSMEKAAVFKAKWPSLDRDMGAKVLAAIQTAPLDIRDPCEGITFAGDGLFCEWCYVIDLDKNTLEVFTGFHTEPMDAATERFAFLDDPKEEYRPVKHAATWPLDKLPTKREFIRVLKRKDDDEEAA